MKILAILILTYLGGVGVCLTLWVLGVLVSTILVSMANKPRDEEWRNFARAIGTIVLIPLWPYILVMFMVYGVRWVKGTLADDSNFANLLKQFGLKKRTPQDRR